MQAVDGKREWWVRAAMWRDGIQEKYRREATR
jgi:hypothetical protein